MAIHPGGVGSYCPVIRFLCRRVFHWLCRQPSVGEESLTDWLLFEVSERLPLVRYVKFTRFEEARSSGADWVWWFIGPDVSMAWRVQAKRLKRRRDHYDDLAYSNNLGGQVEKLLESARASNLLPFYVFYHAPDGVPTVRCDGIPNSGTGEGVFISDAKSVYETFIEPGRTKVVAEQVVALGNPLSCMFCCQVVRTHNSSVKGLVRYVERHHRGAMEAIGGQTESPGLHLQLPAHVSSLLQSPPGEIPSWYWSEFHDGHETGALLVFDLRENIFTYR